MVYQLTAEFSDDPEQNDVTTSDNPEEVATGLAMLIVEGVVNGDSTIAADVTFTRLDGETVRVTVSPVEAQEPVAS